MSDKPNKQKITEDIRTWAEQKLVTRAEVLEAYDEGSGKNHDQILTKKLGISEILYYIGGGVVFIGISILIAQNWQTLNFATKLLSTLGAGIAAYIVGLLFTSNKKTETIGSAFYLISALVMPIGLYVVFDKAGLDAGSALQQTLISGLLFAMYFVSYFVFRKNIFTLFSIVFGTWAFFSLTNLVMNSGTYLLTPEFYEYRVIAVGLSYIFLGYSFSQNERAPLSGVLYSFGILGVLGTAMALGGWEPNQNLFWELLFPILVFATLFVSTHLKSKSFLTFGSLFLMAYILKITGEYFTSGLGWPLALVIAGLSLIGVGYLFVSLRKKYIVA